LSLFDLVCNEDSTSIHLACHKCPLLRTKSYKIPGRGNRKNPKLIIIGESLGSEEFQAGKVFVGKCGKLQSKVILQSGLNEDKDVYITNVIKCYPGKNKKLTKAILKRCLPFLMEELREINCRYILLYGSWASIGVLGQPIGQMHNKVFFDNNRYIGAIYHPAYYMRLGKESQYVADFHHMLKRMSNKEIDICSKGKDVDKIEHISVSPKELGKIKFKCKVITHDIEANGLDFYDGDKYITCNAFCDDYYKAYTCPGWNAYVRKAVQKIYLDYRIVLQHSKFDAEFLKYVYDIDCKRFFADTELMAYIVNPTRKFYNLSSLVFEYAPELIGYDNGIKKGGPNKVFGEALEHYNAGDAIATFRIFYRLWKIIRKLKMEFLLFGLIMPVEKIFHQAELRGVKFDLKYIEKLNEITSFKINQVMKEVKKLTMWSEFENAFGKTPNLSSDEDIEKIFRQYYEVNKTEFPSFSKLFVMKLSKLGNEFAPLLLQYRKWAKLKGTYVKGVRSKLKGDLLHSPYRQTTTVTGRTSSGGKGAGEKARGSFTLQTMPPGVRAMIMARNGFTFVIADYRTVEVRVAGALSHEDAIYQACISGHDFHTAMASNVFHVPIEDVSPALRRRGKTITFGIIYGITPIGLAAQIGCSEEEAEVYILEYEQGVPNLMRFKQEIYHTIEKQGILRTPLGRIRKFPSATEKDKREAFNMIIQVTASDLTKLSLIQMEKEIMCSGKQDKVFQLMQTHDDVVQETLETEKEWCKETLEYVMTKGIRNVYPVVDELMWKVPLEVGIKINKRYL